MISLDAIAMLLANPEQARSVNCSVLGYASSKLPGTLSFLDDSRAAPTLAGNPNVTGVLVDPRVDATLLEGKCLIPCRDARFAFHLLLDSLSVDREPRQTRISPTARIGAHVTVSGIGVVIGDDVVLEDFVTIGDWVQIGARSVIRSGARVGMQGVEQKRSSAGEVLRIVHRGGVQIGSDVEVGPNVVVDRAVLPGDDTIIGDSSVVAALSHVSHNVRIGRRAFLAGGSIVCGSSVVGDDAWVGPNATVSNSITVGQYARVEIGSAALRSVAEGNRVLGFRELPPSIVRIDGE